MRENVNTNYANYAKYANNGNISGLVAMTLYDHIKFAMFGIWVACFMSDVVIVALSLLYGNIQLNRKRFLCTQCMCIPFIFDICESRINSKLA